MFEEVKISKIDTLDGLRGLAVLLVIWSHFPQVGNSGLSQLFNTLAYYFYTGYFGVDIFFALSGFLITRILIAEKAQGLPLLRRFYLKRFLRIFPIFYITIALAGVLITWENMDWVAAYLSNYFFSFNPQAHPMRHSWSLCVEEHYYLVWPLLISFLSLQSSQRVITFVLPVIGILSAVVFLQGFESPTSENLVYRATNTRILTLSVGSALAFHENSLRNLDKKWMAYALLSILLAFGFMRSHYKLPIVDQLSAPMVKYLFSSVIAVLSLITFLILEGKPGIARAIAVSGPLRYTGKISYGLYLYHYPIFYLMGITESQTEDPVSVMTAATAIVLVFGVASISYRFIEAPLLRLKDKV